MLTLALRFQIGQTIARELLDLRQKLIHRMAAEIQAQRLTFSGQPLLFCPRTHAGTRNAEGRLGNRIDIAEQILHANRVVATALLRRLHGVGNRRAEHGPRQILAPRLQAVQRTRAHQGLQRTLVDGAPIHTAAEIQQRHKGSACIARRDDGGHRALTKPLDGAQPVDNLALVVDREVEFTQIDIGHYQRQPHLPAFLHQGYHLVGVLHVSRQHSRHEVRRVVFLEPGRLIGDQGVGSRVRLVEAVTRELFHQVENGTRPVRIDLALLRALHERVALLRHLFRFFLAHGAAQHVGATEAVIGQHLRDLHHLLLIQDHAIGVGEHWFQIGVWIIHFGTAVLAVDEVVHHARAERPRTKQRHQSDDVFKAAGQQALDEVLHATGFELEHSGRLAALQQFVDFPVIQREFRDVQRFVPRGKFLGVDHLDCPVDNRQRAQPQEVELHQTRGFDIILVELGNQTLPVLITVKGREISELGWRDHHSPGVLADIAREPFQLERHLHDFLGILIAFDEFTQLRLLRDRFFQRNAHFERNQLGQLVSQTIGLALHTCHVAHDSLGSHGAEGNDLRHGFLAVHLCHMLNDAIAAIHAEIHVEVRHRHTLRIEKTLEQQVITQRVKIGNAQRIGDNGPGARTTARPDGNVVVARPLDEFHHDQEVPGEAHLDDHVELEGQPVVVGFAGLRSFLVASGPGE